MIYVQLLAFTRKVLWFTRKVLWFTCKVLSFKRSSVAYAQLLAFKCSCGSPLELCCLLLLIYRGLTLEDLPFEPEYYKELWTLAQQQVSEWPGFKRLTLSAEDKAYFEDQIARAEREDL